MVTKWRCWIAPAMVVFLASASPVTARAAGQDPARPALLTVDEIVGNLVMMNARRIAKLRSYHSTRIYELDYRGFPSHLHARLEVIATYEVPQKKFTIVSEQGSKLLLNRVLRKLVASEQEAGDTRNRGLTELTNENYKFELLGMEAKENRPCYLLRVEPRHNNKFLYKGKIWVDAADFALVRVEARPAKNPSFWISETNIEHRYARYGEFWLPASNRSTTKVRLGGKAVLTIDYGQYEVKDTSQTPVLAQQPEAAAKPSK